MFSYFNNRLKNRLNNLNTSTEKNNGVSKEVLELTKLVLNYMEKEEAVKTLI